MEDVAYEDQVPRLEQFRAEHPEIEIRSPIDNQSGFWKAYRDGMILSVQHDLRWLLDHLEQVK
jgi:hypothetical protein